MVFTDRPFCDVIFYIHEQEVQPGFVICDPSRPVHYTNRFDAQINIVEFKSIMAAGYQCVLHLGSATEEVVVSELLHKVDKKTGKKTKLPPQFLKQGDSAIVRIEVAENVCVETYAEHPNLGRFTLRDEGGISVWTCCLIFRHVC